MLGVGEQVKTKHSTVSLGKCWMTYITCPLNKGTEVLNNTITLPSFFHQGRLYSFVEAQVTC